MLEALVATALYICYFCLICGKEFDYKKPDVKHV